MKANELRIGNTIDAGNGTEANVIAILKDGTMDTTKGSGNISEFNPIPLTEEWLVKFGIVDLNANEVYGCGDWHTDLKNEVVGICGNDSCTSGMIFFAKCQYVHQLQNLYFCLTGEELTIK